MDKGRDMACHARTEFGVQSDTVETYSHTPSQSSRITRRGFLGFFLLGGVISLLGKKVKGVIGIEDEPRKAMFWRKTDA